MSQLPIPAVQIDTRSGRYTLVAPFEFRDTGITGHSLTHANYSITTEGDCFFYAGFRYDGPTGGIPTPSMLTASLFHDLICSLTKRKLLPWECRIIADREFRRILKRYSQSPFESAWAWVRWAGVRFNSIRTRL